jgi:hypothetical protein
VGLPVIRLNLTLNLLPRVSSFLIHITIIKKGFGVNQNPRGFSCPFDGITHIRFNGYNLRFIQNHPKETFN